MKDQNRFSRLPGIYNIMTARTVTVFRNGDIHFPGKKIVINPNHFRTFSSFCDSVTTLANSKVAVRRIVTPCTGTKVCQLETLEQGGNYVAVGPEKFKKVKYGDIQNIRPSPRKPEKPFAPQIYPVKHSRIVISGRYKKVALAEIQAQKIIYVFRNDDVKKPSQRILLDKRTLLSMELVLTKVTEKVHLLAGGAVLWLFTLDGHEVKYVSDLENHGQYVAVGHGKHFKKVAYMDTDHFSLTPRRALEIKERIASKKAKSKKYRQHQKMTSDSNTMSPKSETTSGVTSSQDSRQQSLEGKRHRKDKRESRRTSEEEPPARVPPLIQPKDDDKPHEDVYKASGVHKVKAQEIVDDKGARIERPIDDLPAEEVEESEDVVEEIADDPRTNQPKTSAAVDEDVVEELEKEDETTQRSSPVLASTPNTIANTPSNDNIDDKIIEEILPETNNLHDDTTFNNTAEQITTENEDQYDIPEDIADNGEERGEISENMTSEYNEAEEIEENINAENKEVDEIPESISTQETKAHAVDNDDDEIVEEIAGDVEPQNTNNNSRKLSGNSHHGNTDDDADSSATPVDSSVNDSEDANNLSNNATNANPDNVKDSGDGDKNSQDMSYIN